MAYKQGFASVNSNFNRNREDNNDIQVQFNQLLDRMITGRVLDIILDSDHPRFDEFGGFSGLGTILIEKTENTPSNPNLNNAGYISATPLLSNVKNYPLINEIVILFLLPNKELYKNNDEKQYYYLNPISIWNNQHINAYPNITTSPLNQQSERKSYEAIEEGQTRKSTNEEINYNYGSTFIERSNIHPLLPYAGDIIIEGRWGNSIRFGSTVQSNNLIYNNDWWKEGENGNPITIIRNGQPEDVSSEGYLPIVENINTDLSSIYLTSNQAIPLETSVNTNPSVGSLPPQSVKTYAGSQVILNSDRLVFNSKNDSILLDSNKTISIASDGPVGIFSKNGDIVLQSARNNIKLGDKDRVQPIIKGDIFLNDFKLLLEKIQILSEKLTGEPQLKVSTLAAGSLKQVVDQILLDIENYKSKIVKTA